MTEPIDAIDLDRLVQQYVALTDEISAATAERDRVTAQLRALAPGKYATTFGIGVTVSPPPRKFNIDNAWKLLTEEQRALCVSPDAALIKQQLPPLLTESCMDPGTGEPKVTVK